VDHIYPVNNQDEDTKVAILYADPTNQDFPSIHQQMKKMAEKGKIK